MFPILPHLTGQRRVSQFTVISSCKSSPDYHIFTLTGPRRGGHSCPSFHHSDHHRVVNSVSLSFTHTHAIRSSAMRRGRFIMPVSSPWNSSPSCALSLCTRLITSASAVIRTGPQVIYSIRHWVLCTYNVRAPWLIHLCALWAINCEFTDTDSSLAVPQRRCYRVSYFTNLTSAGGNPNFH